MISSSKVVSTLIPLDSSFSAFTGESVDPDKTAQEIKNEIDRLRKNGIDKERFEAVKRKIYGSRGSSKKIWTRTSFESV